ARETGGTPRYADGRVAGGFLCCVRERHEPSGPVINELVRLPADGSSEPEVLVDGHDFFSNPRFSQDGRKVSWLAWDLPDMPWDGTELWTGEITSTGVAAAHRVAGGHGESLFQPEWGPGGELFVISDRTGW